VRPSQGMMSGSVGCRVRQLAGTAGWATNQDMFANASKFFEGKGLDKDAPVAQLDRAPDFESVQPPSESFDNSITHDKHWGGARPGPPTTAAFHHKRLALWLAPRLGHSSTPVHLRPTRRYTRVAPLCSNLVVTPPG
jgi:hypothetical protein